MGSTIDDDTLPQAADQVPGALGSDRYALGALLGRGGMGEVRSARDAQFERHVAIKRIRDASASADERARFLREAQIQGRLDHPAIVPVHEILHDTEGCPAIVMKLIGGRTLAEALRDGKLSQQRLLRQFTDVCRAVEFAHSRGVIHRDLKPANIAIGEHGEIYVLDWGIAKLTGETVAISDGRERAEAGATRDGAILGTPGYMPPEQLRGEPLDVRADVYALGCILFEILSGEPLHPRTDPMASTLRGDGEGPAHRVPDRDIAPELDAACRRATRADSAERFASAYAFAETIETYLDGDRDLTARKVLATQLLGDARRALAQGDGATHRRDAIRFAARGLALDPTSSELATLIGRLMIEPPKEVPADVEREVERTELQAIRVARKAVSPLLLLFCVTVPIWRAAGIRSGWLLGSLLMMGVGTVGRWVLVRDDRLDPIARLVMHVAFGAGFFLVGVVATPIWALPLAILWTSRIANHPRAGSRTTIVAIVSVGIVGPLLLQVMGVLDPGFTFVGSEMCMHMRGAVALDGGIIMTGFACFSVLLVASSVMLNRTAGLRARIDRRTLELQAWQLRQLVS